MPPCRRSRRVAGGGFQRSSLGSTLPRRLGGAAGDLQPQRAAPHSGWLWPLSSAPAVAEASGRPYRRKYDLTSPREVRLRAEDRDRQGATVFVSDLLSDNLFYFNLHLPGRQFRSVFENISILGLYINQTRRLNRGVGAFRFKATEYAGDFNVAYTRIRAGLRSAPVSALEVHRIEGQATIEHSDQFDSPSRWTTRAGWAAIANQYLTFVHDNALWTATGPIDGRVLSVTGGVSSEFSNARFDSYTSILDGRQYLRLAARAPWLSGAGALAAEETGPSGWTSAAPWGCAATRITAISSVPRPGW